MTALPSTMKAAVWEGHPYHISIKEIPRPTLQSPDDIIVKLTTSAICGTDLHIYHGRYGGDNPPWAVGHEGVGTVVEKGSNVQSLNVGDHIVIPDGILTPTPGAYGLEGVAFGITTGTVPYLGGLQAQYARVPAADENTLKLPTTTNDNNFIMLSDIFATAWQSVTGSGFQAGDTVAVYGAGPVGLLAVYSALLRGASRVYSIDHVDSRLAKAQSIGAVPIDLKKGSPADQILQREPTGVNRILDCVGFECVNAELKPQEDYIVNDAIHLAAFEGGIFITGVYDSGKKSAGEPLATLRTGHIQFNIVEWWRKNITINGGGIIATSIYNTLFRLIEDGRANPAVVVDRIVTIDEVPQAYRDFSDQKVGKVLIHWED